MPASGAPGCVKRRRRLPLVIYAYALWRVFIGHRTHKIPGTPEVRGAVSTDVESDFNPMGSNNLKRNDSMNWMTHSKLPQRSGSIGNAGCPDWSRSQSSSRSSRCNSAQASTNRSNDDFGELRDFRHLFSLLHGLCQRNPAGNVTKSASVSKIRIWTGGIPILTTGTSATKDSSNFPCALMSTGPQAFTVSCRRRKVRTCDLCCFYALRR